MKREIESSWNEALETEFTKPYFTDLERLVDQEYNSKDIYPAEENIFAAFNKCALSDIKVVILGQDPYHGPGQAHGLSFSVNDGVKHPPSLVNIFKEIKSDLNIDIPESGNLERWAEQGVLLLNATLTVESHQAGSHQRKGWEKFTDAAIKCVAEQNKNVVFMLWGAYAQKKGAFINSEEHLILKSPHPSPLSVYRGFSGNKHFSKTNDYLTSKGKATINW